MRNTRVMIGGIEMTEFQRAQAYHHEKKTQEWGKFMAIINWMNTAERFMAVSEADFNYENGVYSIKRGKYKVIINDSYSPPMQIISGQTKQEKRQKQKYRKAFK